MKRAVCNRWFLLACGFLAVNGYAVLRSRPPVLPPLPADPVHVEPAAPASEAPSLDPVVWRHLQQVDVDAQGRIVLALVFNRPVAPAVLGRHLRIENNRGQSRNAHVTGEDPATRLLVAVEARADETLNVTVAKGLHGETGPERLEADVRRGIVLQPGIALTGIEALSGGFDAPRIRLTFSRPVEAASLRRAVRMEPAVDASVIEVRSVWRGHAVELSGDFERGRIYRLHIGEGVAAQSGYHRLDRPIERDVFIPDAAPAIRIAAPGRFLSTRGSLQVPLESINVTEFTVRAARLPERNLVQFAMREGGHYRHYWGDPADRISVPKAEKTFSLDAPANTLMRHGLDLRDLLPGEQPVGAWYLEIVHAGRRAADRVVVAGDLGMTVRYSASEMLVWANSIHTVQPVEGARVELWSAAAEPLVNGVTDAAGVAVLPLDGDRVEPFLVTVRLGEDTAFLSLADARLPSGAPVPAQPYLREGFEAFIYTDRGVYRPGETAHARVIVRGPDMAPVEPMPVSLHVFRPDGRIHSRSSAMLSPFGTAEFDAPWAMHDATGHYRLELRLPGAEEALGQARVAVEEFVPPRMAVDVDAEPEHGQSDAVSISLAARYLFGAPAAHSPYQLTLHASDAPFAPADYPDFTFGDAERAGPTQALPVADGLLDSAGLAQLTIRLPDAVLRPPAMLVARFNATVREQGGRTVTAGASLPLHVYPFYIGARKSVHAGRGVAREAAEVEIRLVAPDGKAHPAVEPLGITLERITWSAVWVRDSQGRYRCESNRRLSPVHSIRLATTSEGIARYPLPRHATGAYLLRIEGEGGVATSMMLTLGGDPAADTAAPRIDQVELQWDRPLYAPGDTARLTAVAPFGGRALLTVEQDRLLAWDTVNMEGNTVTFEIPVTEGFRPNAHATVHVLRAPEPGAPPVVRATGTLPLQVDARARRLAVSVSAPGESRPGSPLAVDLEVRDAEGNPVRSEVAVAAVDEAICMLTDFRTPDPVAYFTALRRPGFQAADLYGQLLPESDPETASYDGQVGGDLGALLRGRLNPVRSRRFQPVALWRGGLETDAGGRARVVFDIPEFSGRLRLMAVAVETERAGSGEAAVVIRRPFTLLASLPRFLAPGDATQMDIELQHNGHASVEVRLDMRVEGPASMAGDPVRDVRLAPGERHAFPVPVQAAEQPGVARFTLTARLEGDEITERIELPVRPAASHQYRFTHVALEAGQSVAVEPRGNWMDGTASMQLELSPRPAIGLAGALDYLVRYPYGCLEQTLSAAFPVLWLVELPDLPGAHRVPDPAARVRGALNRVFSMQNATGAFGWWPHADAPYDWGSVYAMHFVILARRAGFDPPAPQVEAGLQHLRQRLARPVAGAGQVGSPEWRRDAALRAHICHVLALAEAPRHDWTERLMEQTQWLDAEGRLRLAMALAAGGRRRDARSVLEELNGAALPESAADGGMLESPARTAALALRAWLEIDPGHPGIPARMAALLAHQRDGRWRTTQENAAAFDALAYHLQVNRTRHEPYRGRFRQGESEDRPLAGGEEDATFDLLPGNAVVLGNEGPGTLYATVREGGVPLGMDEASDSGLVVRRRYLDLQREPVSDMSVRQGDLILVEIEIDTRGRRRDNLVVEDLLPAGLEIENPNLRTAEFVPWAKGESNLPLRHHEMRDDRLLLFTGPFSGIHRFYYAVRAVTPGEYARPPVTAEGMYAPEVRSVHHAGMLNIHAPSP